jgi:hypothetical protein
MSAYDNVFNIEVITFQGDDVVSEYKEKVQFVSYLEVVRVATENGLQLDSRITSPYFVKDEEFPCGKMIRTIISK